MPDYEKLIKYKLFKAQYNSFKIQRDPVPTWMFLNQYRCTGINILMRNQYGLQKIFWALKIKFKGKILS